MKNYKRAKIMFMAFLATCLLFFTNDCQLIDVQKTAIIVALGIDAQENELEITAQIAIPQATDTQTSNSDAILSAKGKTLFEAIDNIGVTTGWYPKLAFCNLIIFGKSLLEKDFLPIIDYMLTSDRFVNSAILAAAEGSAKDVLSSPTPLDFVSSFALEKILVRDIDRANTVLVTDIREFSSDTRSESGFSYMPLIKKKQTDDKAKGDSSNNSGGESNESSTENKVFLSQKCRYKSIIDTSQVAGGGATGKGGSDGGGSDNSSDEGKNIFDARTGLLFNSGKYACTTTPEQTLCYNALNEKVTESFFTVSYEKNGKTINSVVSVVGNERKIAIKLENGIPKYTAKLTLFCKSEEIDADYSTGKLAFYDIASKECLNALAEKTQKTLYDLFRLSKENNCDVFEIKNLLYRHIPANYPSFKDNALNISQIKFEVECVNKT